VLSLQAAVFYLLNRLLGTSDFGVMDLLHPTSKRTQKFLSVMKNFWLFCNDQYEDVNKVQVEVDKLVRARGDLENKVEDYKNRLNHLKCMADEDKQEEEMLAEEIDQGLAHMLEMTATQKELNNEKERLSEELASVDQIVDDLQEKGRVLEMERDKLQGVFEGAAVLHRLELELQEVREEMEIKEKRKLEFRNNLEVLDQLKGEYNGVLELVKQVETEQKKTRKLEGKIRENEGRMTKMKLELEEEDNVRKEKEVLVEKRREDLNTLMMKWKLRKNGKEEELKMFHKEEEEARQKLGEEEIAMIDISNKIRDIHLKRDEEVELRKREAALVRCQYAALLEAIEKFNQQLASDFEKLEKAKDKLDQSPSAL